MSGVWSHSSETQAGEGRPSTGSSLPGPALLSGAERLRPGAWGSSDTADGCPLVSA